ncbi:MAG: hypothetical protein GC162_01065 [Planctomycetes bacterium]|nr:hypothetical protein [Planctomycetota bacterium]
MVLCGVRITEASVVLFSDNFNVADNANFDSASTAGRLGGTLASTVVVRSEHAQQSISGNQLRMIKPASGSGRIRFENAGGPFGVTNQFNWASGATGTAILAAGGFSVQFDWTAPTSSNTNWISFSVGHDTSDPGTRVNSSDTDYGILLRNNGQSQAFDNAADLGTQASFATTFNSQTTVRIDVSTLSFADGAGANAKTYVGNTLIDDYTFTWNNNSGVIRMQIGAFETGELIDNLTVTTLIPTPTALPAGLSLLMLTALSRRR